MRGPVTRGPVMPAGVASIRAHASVTGLVYGEPERATRASSYSARPRRLAPTAAPTGSGSPAGAPEASRTGTRPRAPGESRPSGAYRTGRTSRGANVPPRQPLRAAPQEPRKEATTADHDLAHAERALLDHAAAGRTRVRAGSLTACLAPGQADALMHVAVPSGPEPPAWGPSVEALAALRREHGVVPRLEFMAELHPTLPEALERHGFVRASSDPVMTADLRGGPAAAGTAPAGYRRLGPEAGPLLGAFVRAQAQAFGLPAVAGYAFLERLEGTIDSGVSLAAALLREGAPVAGAVLQLGSSGWAELAGVFTAAAMRRQGLAGAVCARLLAEAQEAGVSHVWLSAAESARGLYARLGFRTAGTQLNYRYAPFSVPPPG